MPTKIQKYFKNLSFDVIASFSASAVILLFTTLHINSPDAETRMIGSLFGALSLQTIVNSINMFLNYPKIYLSPSPKDKLKQIKLILNSIKILVILYVIIMTILILSWMINGSDLLLITCALMLSTMTALLLENRTIIVRWKQNLGVYSAVQSLFSLVMFGLLTIGVNFYTLNLNLILACIFTAAMSRVFIILICFNKKIHRLGPVKWRSMVANYIGLFQLSGLISLLRKHGLITLFSVIDSRFLGEVIITFRAFDFVGSGIERLINMLMVNLKHLSRNLLRGAIFISIAVFFLVYGFSVFLYPQIFNDLEPLMLLGVLRILSTILNALAGIYVHQSQLYIQNVSAILIEMILFVCFLSFFPIEILTIYLFTSVISSTVLLMARKL